MPLRWLCLVLLIAGCARLPERINPEVWWHDLEGGAIAQQRPPPPNADLPYPNLATVPAKPTPPDPAVRQRVSAGLLANRADAQYAAAQYPIAPIPRVSAPPPPAANPDASTATMEATQATSVKSPAIPATPPAPATESAALDAGPPNLPSAPPPPPVLPGISIGPIVPIVPVKAPPAPAPAPLTPTEAARAPVPIPFAAGSAVLPPGVDGQLKLLAQRRANKPIEIIGFGEATDSQPQVQTAGITLGLARARAVAVVLVAAGVPAYLLRIDAQAAGRGADARLVD